MNKEILSKPIFVEICARFFVLSISDEEHACGYAEWVSEYQIYLALASRSGGENFDLSYFYNYIVSNIISRFPR